MSQPAEAPTLRDLNKGKSAQLWLFFVSQGSSEVIASYEEIRAATGLSSATISDMLRHLGQLGLVEALGPTLSDGTMRYAVHREILASRVGTLETKVPQSTEPASALETKVLSTSETEVPHPDEVVSALETKVPATDEGTLETKVQVQTPPTSALETKVPESFKDSSRNNLESSDSTESGAPTENPGKGGQKKTRPRDLMFDAIVEVCQLNPKIDGSYVAKTKKALLDMGKTPEDVKALGEYWYANDWRGQKGQPPTLNQLVTDIEKPRASRNGSAPHRDKGDEEDAELAERQRAYIAERMKAKHAHRSQD